MMKFMCFGRTKKIGAAGISGSGYIFATKLGFCFAADYGLKSSIARRGLLPEMRA